MSIDELLAVDAAGSMMEQRQSGKARTQRFPGNGVTYIKSSHHLG